MTTKAGKHPGTRKTGVAERLPLPPKARRHQPAVAVLPFLDLRRESGDAPLAEGIAEELIQALNQVEGLRAISRTTSFLYGG